MRLEESNHCNLCKEIGAPLYQSLKDTLYGVGGLWSFSKCESCGLIWLSPRPVADDIGRVYERYFTHDRTKPDRSGFLRHLLSKLRRTVLSDHFSYREPNENDEDQSWGAVMSQLPAIHDYVGTKVMFLRSGFGDTLLDVGCGNGTFLVRMRALGWTVSGVESDKRAVKVARERYNLDVRNSTLEEAEFPEKYFDAVTLSHVIEHVHNPHSLLTECQRILKPGGRIVILTPNSESLGHRFFKENWLGLDPPRHIFVFTRDTLSRQVRDSHFRIGTARTTSRWALTVWLQSRSSGYWAQEEATTFSVWITALGLLFYMLEEAFRLVNSNVGEEILLVGSKQN